MFAIINNQYINIYIMYM